MKSSILDSTPWIPSSSGTLYLIPDLCQRNLDSGFQSSVGFWIPNPRIPRFLRPPTQKNNFVDSLTWEDLMFKEVLKCLRADRTKHVIGRAHIRRVASRRVAPIEPMLMTNIVPI